MYELIAPRKFKPIECFEQFVDSGFSILAEPYKIIASRSCSLNESVFKECKDTGLVDTHSIHYQKLKNGLRYVELKVSSYLPYYKYHFDRKGQSLPKGMSKVYYNSSLLMTSVYPKAKAYFNNDLDNTLLMSNFAEEAEVAADLLAECKKVAFLVHFTRLVQLKRILRNQGLSKLSVGRKYLWKED